jgi:ABC-type nitrate/sulfonate/bicarbonate transport system substrate-binding protein
MNVRRSRAAMFAVGIAATLSITTACSSSGTSSGATAGSDSTATTTLTVGTQNGNFGAEYQYVAQQLGYFKQHDLNVNFVSIPNSAQQTEALESGSLDIAMSEISSFLRGSKTTPMQILSGAVTAHPIIYGLDSAKCAAASQPYPAPLTCLKGKTILVPVLGTGPQLIVEKMLAAANISPSQVHFLAGGAPPTNTAALAAGRGDATYDTPAFVPEMEAAGLKLWVVADSSDYKGINLSNAFFPNLPVATTATIKKNPTAIKNYCTAVNQAITWMRDPSNKAQLTTLTEKFANLTSASSAWAQIAPTLPTLVTHLSTAQWANAQALFSGVNPMSYSTAVYSGCA